MMLRRLPNTRTLLFNLILFSLSMSAYAQSNKVEYREVDGKWISFFQTVDASFLKQEVNFRVSASLKARQSDYAADSAIAAFWVRVDDKEDNTIFYKNSMVELGSEEWETRLIDGVVNEQAGTIYIGGLCVNEGEFFFDNFEFLVENENGDYVKAPLKNPSFEEKIVGNTIPKWSFGVNKDIRERTRGFSISNSSKSFSGENALLIVGKNLKEDSTEFIGAAKGFTPQIGVLVSMLNNLKSRVESKVYFLSQQETDYQYDSIANSIGALIMHLAAAEAIYQVYTFDEREYFNDEEEEKWGAALRLGEEARGKFTEKPISYYLEEYDKIRKRTLEELKKRDDEWLMKIREGSGSSNFSMWFHVMEHQSSHLGQIRMQMKRYPKEEMLNYKLEEY